MDLKKLLFGKVENVDEFIEKSNSKVLKWAFLANIAILVIVVLFLDGGRIIPTIFQSSNFEHFTFMFNEIFHFEPIFAISLILEIIFLATLIFICVIRSKHKKELDEKFLEYKKVIEQDEELLKKYNDCYYKRARDYVLVNGYFFAKNENSKVKMVINQILLYV